VKIEIAVEKSQYSFEIITCKSTPYIRACIEKHLKTVKGQDAYYIIHCIHEELKVPDEVISYQV